MSLSVEVKVDFLKNANNFGAEPISSESLSPCLLFKKFSAVVVFAVDDDLLLCLGVFFMVVAVVVAMR